MKCTMNISVRWLDISAAPQGGLLVAISMIVHPNDQISQARPYESPLKTSGAMNAIVPCKSPLNWPEICNKITKRVIETVFKDDLSDKLFNFKDY